MRFSGRIVMAAVAALALALFLTQTFAQTRAPRVPANPRVAVCDVGAVFNGYGRRDNLNAELDKKRRRAKDEDQKRVRAIEKIEKTLKQLKEGSAQHKARLDELKKLTINRVVWREFEEKAFMAEHRKMMEALYREILAAVAATAKQEKFDLVIYREDVDVASMTTTELYKKIAQRKCLYSNPAIDLTKAVLKRLNR